MRWFWSVTVWLRATTISLSSASCCSLITAWPTAINSGSVTTARPNSTRPSSVRGRPILILYPNLRPDAAVDLLLRPMSGRELALPVERARHDVPQVVMTGCPAEHPPDLGGFGHQRRRIPRAARRFLFFDRVTRDGLDHLDDFPDAVAAPVAAVQCRGFAAATQVLESLEVRCGEILDMDVVAYPRAVGRIVVRPEDMETR